MMFNFQSFVFTALLASSQASDSLRSIRAARSLSFELIAGYEPKSAVTDHNSVDLDQQAMEVELGKETDASFLAARAIYENGGHSKSLAHLTIPTGLPTDVSAGTTVTGVDAAGQTVTGSVYTAATAGATKVTVRYATSDVQASYSNCQVGGLVETNVEGCFVDTTGTINVGSEALTYTYTAKTDNTNGRTLQGFSTSAESKMRENGTGDYYDDFQKFVNYYGVVDYSDDIVKAGFEGAKINLNGKNFDFSSYSLEGRAQIVKKTSVYAGVAMYVIRELEDAIDDCLASDPTRNEGSVKALDEAVAFYTGSLEGIDGSGSGVFMYALADKRCANFRTCGESANSSSGTANINLQLFRLFDLMKADLNINSCEAARGHKEEIVKKMFVPIIQGALRYAYIQEDEVDSGEVAEAEGAAFAAAVLPVVAACNTGDAAIIFEHLMPASGNTADFSDVKLAFERNYGCMGITCGDVGGLYSTTLNKFLDGAHPCNSGGSGVQGGAVLGLSVGAIALVAVLCLMARRRRSDVEMKTGDDNQI